MWKVLLAVAFAGALGGILNSVLAGSGLTLPHVVFVDGATVVMPGVVGNLAVGAGAALLSFGLYGPLAGAVLFRGASAPAETNAAPVILTLGAFAGAVLVGFSGGRWVTAEAERSLNHGTAVAAAEVARRAETRLRAATPPTGPGTSTELLRALQSESPLDAYRQARLAWEASGQGNNP
jgi:hypothetical protein